MANYRWYGHNALSCASFGFEVNNMIQYKVAGNTRTEALAAALAGSIEHDTVQLTAIGAAAVNACIKAAAVAEKMINGRQPEEAQSEILIHSEFTEITIDELTRQAICLTLTLAPKNTAGGMLA